MTTPDPDPIRERLRRFECIAPSIELRQRIVSLATPRAPWGALLAAAAAVLLASLGDSCLIAPRMARLTAPVRTRPAIEFAVETPYTRLLAVVGAPRSSEPFHHPLMLELVRGEHR